jgi:Exostosin family
MRIHITPVFEDPNRAWEADKLRRLAERWPSARFELVEDPDAADAILLTDAGTLVSHVRWRPEVRKVLGHPLLRRYPERCLLYHEADVPRPYLRGIYYNMEWFPGVEGFAAAVVMGSFLDGNPAVCDDPPPEERSLLFSYMGRESHALRTRLCATRWDRSDIEVVDTSSRYDHYDYTGGRRDPAMQRTYVDAMRRSCWALCPRGWSAASPRVFEAMRMGIAPVVLNDNWLRPNGPDWDACCLWVPEASLADLPEILESHGERWREMGGAAQRAYRQFFSPSRIFEHIVTAIERLLRQPPESRFATGLRHLREIVAHALGRESPRIARGRRLGMTALQRYGLANSAEARSPSP